MAISDSPAPLPSSVSVSSTWGRPLSVSQEAHWSSRVCPLPLTEARYVRRSFCRRVPSVYKERDEEKGGPGAQPTPAPCPCTLWTPATDGLSTAKHQGPTGDQIGKHSGFGVRRLLPLWPQTHTELPPWEPRS